MAEPTTQELRELLALAREGITIPFDDPDYETRLDRRASMVRVTLDGVENEGADVAHDIAFLRKKLAEEQGQADQRKNRR
ncbi:hypothetical protein ACIPQA_33710 [Streptomyces sp. NPDC090109]|uniref:hypothetical protein n=1 Tax=Streptomyces sp. NPDC090109 TaxID=3365948 RepID=UPI003801C816